MRSNTLAWAVTALFASVAPVHADTLYRRLQSFSHHLVPLPLQCVKEDPAYRAADETFSVLYGLAAPNDRLALMTRDGSYALFTFAEGRNLAPTPVPASRMREVFENFTGINCRVWVVSGDALVGGLPSPPPQYAGMLGSLYTLLPLPLPTYCGDFTAARTSTNFILRQAALLESLAACNPSFMTQVFYTTLGRIYRQCGSNDAALAVYRRGIGQFPESPLILRAMADCCFTAFSNYPEAIDYNYKANQFNKRQNQGQPLYEALFSTAMAYERIGEQTKAILQYNDIIGTIDAFPDSEWESRTRRYLGDLYLRKAMTNEALRQYQIDLDIAGINPAYSFQRLLDVFGAPGNARAYADTAHAYFKRCGANDAYAVYAHIKTLELQADIIKLAEAVRASRALMRARPALVADLRKQADWWALWVAAAARVGESPEP